MRLLAAAFGTRKRLRVRHLAAHHDFAPFRDHSGHLDSFSPRHVPRVEVLDGGHRTTYLKPMNWRLVQVTKCPDLTASNMRSVPQLPMRLRYSFEFGTVCVPLQKSCSVSHTAP